MRASSAGCSPTLRRRQNCRSSTGRGRPRRWPMPIVDLQGAGHGDRRARRPRRDQRQRHAAARHRRLRRRAVGHLRRAAGAAHAAFRGGLRGGVDACRGGAPLRAGADRRGPAACACSPSSATLRAAEEGEHDEPAGCGVAGAALLCSAFSPARAAEAPVLFVEQPIVLSSSEDPAMISAACSAPAGRAISKRSTEAPAYAAIVDTITADVGAIARGDKGRRPHAARIHRRPRPAASWICAG